MEVEEQQQGEEVQEEMAEYIIDTTTGGYTGRKSGNLLLDKRLDIRLILPRFFLLVWSDYPN